MEITATPLALRLARETPQCEHAGITKKRTPLLLLKKKGGFLATYQTMTRQGLCVWAVLLLFYRCAFSFWF